jgi:hypothetical protein
LRDAAVADWCAGISPENVDQRGRRALTSRLDQRVTDVRVVACAAGSVLRGFTGYILRCSVRVERGGALQFRSCRAVDERPGSLDGGARPGVGAVCLLEDGQDLLSALPGVAGYDPQVVNGQVDVAYRARHAVHSRHPGASARRMG